MQPHDLSWIAAECAAAAETEYVRKTTFCPEICDCQNLWILKQTGTLFVLCENVP